MGPRPSCSIKMPLHPLNIIDQMRIIILTVTILWLSSFPVASDAAEISMVLWVFGRNIKQETGLGINQLFSIWLSFCRNISTWFSEHFHPWFASNLNLAPSQFPFLVLPPLLTLNPGIHPLFSRNSFSGWSHPLLRPKITVFVLMTHKSLSPALNTPLGSRFIYPTAYLTLPLSCLIDISSLDVQNKILDLPQLSSLSQLMVLLLSFFSQKNIFSLFLASPKQSICKSCQLLFPKYFQDPITSCHLYCYSLNPKDWYPTHGYDRLFLPFLCQSSFSTQHPAKGIFLF